MTWTEAEAAIRAQMETQWALSAYATIPLSWENENAPDSDRYLAVNIEATFAEKTIFGSVGKRSSVEAGIVYFHAFVPVGTGKRLATAAIEAMTTILELQTIGSFIKLEGGNPPTPVEPYSHRDREVPPMQPGGNYFRCSGSVPFIVISTR